MLNLSDADLARLRLECRRYCLEVCRASGQAEDIEGAADRIVAWCLRDREVTDAPDP